MLSGESLRSTVPCHPFTDLAQTKEATLDGEYDLRLIFESQPANDVEPSRPVNPPSEGEPPDGGYGWVIVVCTFMLNVASWGNNGAFSVYLSYYRKNRFFPEATDTDFAFIGGLSVAVAMTCAPFVNYLSTRFNFKVPMAIGIITLVLSQIFAGLSRRVWQLFLTQGVIFGIGIGFLWIPTPPIVNQWFSKKRSLAGGILSAGSGTGSIIFSLTTQVVLHRFGLKWAFFINAFISLALTVPAVILLKSRGHIIKAKFEPIQYQMLVHPGFVYVLIWGFFSNLGYFMALYSVPTYSTSGLGFSQAQGARLEAILAAGQVVGRPLSGLLLDKFGRINMAALLTCVAGLTCLIIWTFSKTYELLVFFAFVQGIFGGTFWGTCANVTAEVVGLVDLGSALSVLWLTIIIPCAFSEPITLWLIGYSKEHLHRTGGDTFFLAIMFSGATFIIGGLALLGSKRWKQKNWKIFVKT